jgi:beta-lactamase regulating signal transducer with metallopeptidase domain
MGGFTQSALLKALGWSLFDSLWQMALLWLCYMLLTAAFSKMTSHNRHGLAVLLTAAGTGGFVFSFIAHYYSAADGPAADGWLTGLLAAGNADYTLPGIARSIDRLLPWCSCLYLLALTWLFARYCHHYLHSRRIRDERLSKIGPGLRVFVTQTARRMGIKKEIGVWLSSIVDVPSTLGFLRPVILIPVAMINNLSLEQTEAVLLHELAHIKRNDYLLNLWVTITQLLFFFNPFAALLIQTIKKEREHRCDDLVMQFRYDPHVYASALLSLATTGQRRLELALAATGKNDRLLLQRVKRIMKQDTATDRPGPASLIFFVFTVLTACCVLPHPHSTNHLSVRVPVSNRVPVSDRIPAKWSLAEMFASSPPLKKVLSPAEKMGRPKPADPKITHSPRVDEDDQPSDQDNGTEYSTDQSPAAINISITGMNPGSGLTNAGFSSPRPADSSEASRWFAELTDAKSSASEVKAKIAKAIAANEISLLKIREMLNSSMQAIHDLPSSGLRPGERSQRQFLDEQVQWQRQTLRMQQDLKGLLERAAKRLTIVYI